MKRIGVKYCGGCNPQICRTELIEAISGLLSEDCSFETGLPSGQWDAAILVCGCTVACCDRPEIRNLARNWVLVSGLLLDLHPVPVERLATDAADKLNRLVSGRQGEIS
jgi:hypothetical protein